MVPVAAVPPVASGTPTPQTSLEKLLAKNAVNIRLISEPWPQCASACACDPTAIGTSRGTSPPDKPVPTSSARSPSCGRPAFEGSTSTQYSGTFMSDGICENEIGTLASFRELC